MGQTAGHEVADANCETHKCPFVIHWDKCTWEGPIDDLKTHIKSSHHHYETCDASGRCEGGHGNMRVNGAFWHTAVFALDEVFLLYTEAKEVSVYSVLLHIGDKNKHKNFKYELTYESADGSLKVSSIHGVQSFGRDVRSIIEQEDCSVLREKYVNKCLDFTDGLPYSLRVLRN